MNARSEQDINIGWVKSEIEETLKLSRQALEIYVENPNDEAQLRFLTTHLHQVVGTLQIVELYGAALLVEETEMLVNELMEDKISQKDDAYEVIMRAILQIPTYLDNIQQGYKDNPVTLLPLLNDLRTTRGQQLLSEHAFFSPNLNVYPEKKQPETASIDADNLPSYARKLRPLYQTGLVGFFRNNDVQKNLKLIATVVRKLEESVDSDNARQLLWICGGVIEGLYNQGLEANVSLKSLLGQVDRCIKKIIDGGEEALQDDIPKELLKNLLYYVAQTKPNGSRVNELQEAFNLSALIPGDADGQQQGDAPNFGADVIKNVSTAIKEDMLSIKDTLDLFVRSEEKNVSDLEPLIDKLRSVADTLGLLGMGKLRKLIKEQENVVSNAVKNDEKLDESVIMGIASALLFVESSINDLRLANTTDDDEDDDEITKLLPDSEYNQLVDLTITEAKSVLARIKDAFIGFAADTSKPELLKDIPGLINEVKGAFVIVSFGRAADLINSCSTYIEQNLIRGKEVPQQQDLDALADVISGIEYFLENFTIDSSGARKSLDIAQESLVKLGCPPEHMEQLDTDSSADTSAIVEDDASAAEEEPENLGLYIPDDSEQEEDGFELSLDDTSSEDTTPDTASPADDALELSIEDGGDGLEETIGDVEEPDDAAELSLEDTSLEDDLSQGEDELTLSLSDDEQGESLQLADDSLELADDSSLELADDSLEFADDSSLELADDPSLDSADGSLELEDESEIELSEDAGHSEFIEEDEDDEGIDPEILEIFLEEAEEELSSISEQLTNWEANLSDENALASLRRSFHTLKGSGRIVGAIEIGEFAWSIENMLNRVIDTTVQTSPAMFVLLKQARDALPELIEQIKGKGAPVTNVELIAENADKISKGETINLDSGSTPAVADTQAETEDGPQTTSAEPAVEETVEASAAESKTPAFDPVLVEIFTNETKTHLDAIRQFVVKSQENGLPCMVNNDLIRALHTLHGSAHMANVNDIAELSDHLEKYAKLVLENRTEIGQEVVDLLSSSVNAIDEMVHGLAAGATELPGKEKLVAQTVDLYDSEISIQRERLSGDDETISLAATDIDDELVKIFLKEADEILDQTSDILAKWVVDKENIELADELRRHVHTLKGGSKIANLPAVADISGGLENLLTLLVNQQITTSETFVNIVETVHKWLHDSFEHEKAKTTPPQSHIMARAELLQQMNRLAAGYTDDLEVEEISLEMGGDDALGTDEELVNIFVNEAQEILSQVSEKLSLWSVDIENLEHCEELQRSMHMLKGGARMAKVDSIGNVTHQAESLLMKINDAEIKPKQNIINGIQATHDWIDSAVELLKSNGELVENQELIGELAALESTQGSDIDLGITLDEEITLSVDEPESITLEESEAEEIELSSPQEPEISLTDFDSSWDADSDDEEQYDDDLADIFLEEAAEILHKMDDLLHQWSGDPESAEIIEEVQRSLHTLKGGARMANIAPVGDLSHSIETVLEKITGGHLKATPKLVEIVHSAYDWLNSSLEKIRLGESIAQPQELIDEIEISVGLKQPKAKAPQAAPAPEKTPSTDAATAKAAPVMPKKPATESAEDQSARLSAAFATDDTEEDAESADFDMATFTAEAQAQAHAEAQKESKTTDEQVKVSAMLLNNLVNFAGEVSIYRSRVDQTLGAIGYNLTEFDQTIARVSEQLRKFEIEAEAQILFRYEASGVDTAEDFDPLELDRFSNMQQLSRSLVESLGDFKSIKKMLENYVRESEILLLQQSRVSTELQEGLIRTRLVPFANAVPRLRRIIRQTSKELGKSTDFKVVGAEGEMDRSVLDRVIPALEHMLRNAVDHGIEMPDVRKNAKKDKTGRIMLSFKQEGPKIIIRIQDDGAGMNLQAIRKKAVERGLMVENSDLSDNEVMQFVLESGFSTAQKITQISGRGVGMDVVNTEIKQVAGTLHIDTKEGKGSIFTIQLPLTVSANQALIIETGDDHYAIPLSSVDGVIRVSDKELKKLYGEEKPMYKYGGRNYGFFHLGTILGVSKPKESEDGEKIPLILARAGDHNVALLVEQIVGRQEIVIKSVGPQISTVNGISGATIMGDGSIALILDISSLIREGYAHIAKIQVEQEQAKASKTVKSGVPTVMVVDDSITVRKVTERLLKRHKMNSVTAKDGVDALDKLQDMIPDIMLLDIEMPRMDGFELATAIRNDDRLKHVPIIMITSRTGDKHRERATKIGVNAYLGKPFQEPELLENIESLLNSSE